MRYKHIETGAIVDSPSKIISPKWEKIEEKQTNHDRLTKKEILQELDALGIEYSSRANKKELYNLMMQGR